MMSPPADQDTIELDPNQPGQVWYLLFGERGQVEERCRVSKVRQTHAQSNAPKCGVRQEFFIVPGDRS